MGTENTPTDQTLPKIFDQAETATLDHILVRQSLKVWMRR